MTGSARTLGSWVHRRGRPAGRRQRSSAPPSRTLQGARCTSPRYAAERTEPHVVVFRRPQRLVHWCARCGVADAIVGGFFQREPELLPLGEVRTRGVARRHAAFDAPWHRLRGCVHIDGGRFAIMPRNALAESPRGDLLQAGPLLVGGGRSLIGRDPEGFSAGVRQFDSDISAGRYPRAAVGSGGDLIWAVACDGRARGDAGMTLAELADFMLELGAEDAINLDGGGSTSLVCEGRLVNRPRAEHGVELVEGRAVCTATAFVPR